MKFTSLVAIGLMVTSVPVSAQHRGSMEDQLACTPDVYRLCSSEIPDEDDIVACLQRNKAQLSPGCKAVFSRPLPPAKGGSSDN